MRFPYREISRGIFAPMINLEVWTGGRWLECDAYIDSGATYSIFHADVAAILGLVCHSGRKIMIRVGDGKLIPVFLHKLPVQFAGHKFNAVIGFSESLGLVLIYLAVSIFLIGSEFVLMIRKKFLMQRTFKSLTYVL